MNRLSQGMRTTLLVVLICFAWAVLDWSITPEPEHDPLLTELSKAR